MPPADQQLIALRKASPHQWGEGKVHRIDPNEPAKLICGRLIRDVPGQNLVGIEEEITCQNCLLKKMREAEREVREQEWRERQRQWQQQREQENAEWWARYREYLQTPQWAEKRKLVLRRAYGICEGCGIRPAVQAHHLTYDNLGNEFLWELKAVCLICHERFHNQQRARRLRLRS